MRGKCARKEANVLFNNALNKFCLLLYDVGNIVKDHSDSERWNPLPHGLLFLISSKGSFICIIPPFGLKVNMRGKCARKEGNVLFNNTLNKFSLLFYGVGNMVKDHSDSERWNPLTHELLFLISSKGSFICTIPQRIAHTMAFVTPVIHWLDREITQWIHHEGSIERPITQWANTLTILLL